MKRSFLLIFLSLVLCISLCGCAGGYAADGPKVETGEYHQQVLLYDSNGTLTADEIFSRYWRLNDDGSLQSKLETEEALTNHGKGQTYRTNAKELKELFEYPEQLISAEYLLNDLSDGRIYQQGSTDILLLRTAEGSTLLATLEKDGMRTAATSLFLLEPGEIPPTAVPIEYEWNPLAVSPLYNHIYGHRFTTDFQSMVSAIMSGSRTFYCADSENAYRLHTLGAEIFPPYSQIVANVFYEEGRANIIYKTFEDSERQAYLDEFKRSVEYLVRSALKQGDDQTTTAIALYHALSYQLTYDAYAAHDDKTMTTYRALTEYTGNSKAFAAAYAYLCNQMNISAVIAGGVSNSLVSHDWTLVTINDQYYYADPTMETRAGGTGLRYFGLTTQQRYEDHGYAAHMTSIGSSAALWGNNFDISDTRFEPLQDIVDVDQLWRIDGKLTVCGTNTKGEAVRITVE